MQLFSFRNSLLLILLFISAGVFAQDLGSETVVVVKPYTPSVKDAAKMRELPGISDTISLQKLPVQYSIFSVPVASTFTPTKGRAAEVEQEDQIKIYDNYATLGFGSYTSVLAELSSNVEVSRTDNFGIFLTHNSAQGGIEEVWMDDSFYDTELNLNYSSRQRRMTWKTEAGFEHQHINWYGISENYIPLLGEDFEAQQNYFSFYAGGELNPEDSFFEGLSAQYRYFGDMYASSEHRLELHPSLEVPIGGELFNTNLLLVYVGRSFEQDYFTNQPMEYSSLNLGLNSSLVVLRDDLTLNLGAAIYFNFDTQNSETGVYVYPKITASYRMAGEYFIAYAGLEGELEQNSYYGFVQENPFVSPNLGIRPTDQQYDAYIGAKGKLSNKIGYNVRGSYVSENYKALFVANSFPVDGDAAANREEYTYRNSFGIVYDQVKTISVFGELSIDLNRDFRFRVNGELFSYNTEEQAEAWNLPQFKAALIADYQIDESWYAGANFFFVGPREDRDGDAPSLLDPNNNVVELDSYLDLNANLGYRFNDQLSAFVKGHNLLGNSYQRWKDYPVLGLQLLAGITYKFDF